MARLSRDQLKDTSLDYGLAAEQGQEEREGAHAYAERPGLVPESEFVLRTARARSSEVKTAARTADTRLVRDAQQEQ